MRLKKFIATALVSGNLSKNSQPITMTSLTLSECEGS